MYYLSLFFVLFSAITNQLAAQKSINSLAERSYPYWGEYRKTPIPEIEQAAWINKDTALSGWD